MKNCVHVNPSSRSRSSGSGSGNNNNDSNNRGGNNDISSKVKRHNSNKKRRITCALARALALVGACLPLTAEEGTNKRTQFPISILILILITCSNAPRLFGYRCSSLAKFASASEGVGGGERETNDVCRRKENKEIEQ